MWAKIVFFSSVAAATLAVILLAFVSPSPNTHRPKNTTLLAMSLYVQPPQPPNPPHHQLPGLRASRGFIFHHKLTEGPRNTSRVIGNARGLVLPVEHFGIAAFNIIYLTFDTPEYCGSLGIEAMTRRQGTKEELRVVGGTGSFAFARGAAAFVQKAGQQPDAGAMYYIKLRLSLPEGSRAIPG